MTPRQQAIAAGKRRYFTGKACPKGHISERIVANSGCAACQDATRAKNRNKHRVYAREHYQANKAAYIRRAYDWAAANPEKVAEAKRKWQCDNPDYRRP